jgi:hypothetical protein
MHPPASLVKLQEKFGKILLGKLSPQSLTGIDIYCSTYLARLDEVLRKNFPSLPPLVGTHHFFETIAHPFIKKHTPNNWQLGRYGEGLTAWLKKEGFSRLSPLLIPLAEVDEAFLKISFPMQGKGFLKGEVTIIDSPYPLIDIRKALLSKKPLPAYEKKNRSFLLYSDQEGKFFGIEIELLEAKLLKLLKEESLDGALEKLVQDRSLPLDSLETLLPTWSSKWARLQLIQPEKMPSLPL